MKRKGNQPGFAPEKKIALETKSSDTEDEYSSEEEVELPETITRNTPIPIVKISGINGTSESHDNLAFFQQDDDGFVITQDSELGGAYTFNLNTCLAFILIRRDEQEMEVLHTPAGIDGSINSYKCDKLIVVDGGNQGIIDDVNLDPYEEDKETAIQSLIDGRQERIRDLSDYIWDINNTHFDINTEIEHISTNSGAIFVNINGNVQELGVHTLEAVDNVDSLDHNFSDLKNKNYQFDESGAYEAISKPRITLEALSLENKNSPQTSVAKTYAEKMAGKSKGGFNEI